MKHFAFRVDAGTNIGSGHLMRCLTLARHLRRYGSVQFIMGAHKGHLQSLVEDEGFEATLLPLLPQSALTGYAAWLGATQEEDAAATREALMSPCALLIIDHYGIDATWEAYLRPYADVILVIDDLANRRHQCDFLLDMNWGAEQGTRYAAWVPAACRTFLGISYLLLREEFYQAAARYLPRSPEQKEALRVFVCFGGSDPTNETMRVLHSLARCERVGAVDVVIGAANSQREALAAFCRQQRWTLHCQIDYVARLMCQADCAIGAGGTMTWERCFLGLPSLVVAVAENQRADSERYAMQGVLYYMGFFSEITDDDYDRSLRMFLRDAALRDSIRRRGQEIFRGSKVSSMLREVLTYAGIDSLPCPPDTI